MIWLVLSLLSGQINPDEPFIVLLDGDPYLSCSEFSYVTDTNAFACSKVMFSSSFED